jgi:hypothetical protein
VPEEKKDQVKMGGTVNRVFLSLSAGYSQAATGGGILEILKNDSFPVCLQGGRDSSVTISGRLKEVKCRKEITLGVNRSANTFESPKM